MTSGRWAGLGEWGEGSVVVGSCLRIILSSVASTAHSCPLFPSVIYESLLHNPKLRDSLFTCTVHGVACGKDNMALTVYSSVQHKTETKTINHD